MFKNTHKKSAYIYRGDNQNEDKEKKWDERFFLDKIPPYDAYKDLNYLSLGLIKSKIKYENFLEKEKLKKHKNKNPFYSEHYLIDSQPKKKVLNKKLIFSINNKYDSNKINNSQKSYSLTYNHFFEKKKSPLAKSHNFDKKIDNKNKTNFITNYLSPNNKYEHKLTIEESDLLEEFEIIKIMWNKFGVTKKYMEYYVNFLNSLNKKESIKQFLLLEKKQMQKFKYDLTQLLKKIINRNDEINNLKQLINLYINIQNEKKFYHEKNNENLENLSMKNEKKIISDINDCLLAVRIDTINVINQIKNFALTNSYYFYMNKIDLNKIKNDYHYNDEYLLSIKNDLDFVYNPEMQNIYDFENVFGGDPFFLSFTKFPEKDESSPNNKNNEKLKLPINDKMLLEIQNCLFFLNQAEILIKTKNNNCNKNKIFDYLNNNNINNYNSKNSNNANGYGIGSIFKGNIERNIIKLKSQGGYGKLFNFMANKTISNPRSEKIKNYKTNNGDLPLMTSQELKEKFNEYELINSLIYENYENTDDKNIKKSQKEGEYEGEIEQIKIEDNQKEEKEEKEEDEQYKKLKEEKQNELKIIEEERLREKKMEEEKKKKENQKENKLNKKVSVQFKKEEYVINWFTGSLEELTPLYHDYLLKIPQSTKDCLYFPEKSKDFIVGIYPKIIVEKKDNEINGICGINYYNDNNNEFILKINHISAIETNKIIINNFIDLIESTLDYKIMEIELKNNQNEIYDILYNKGFKEYFNNEELENIILRKENPYNFENQNELGVHIKYDSLSILSLQNKNKNKNNDNNTKSSCFNNVINQINLSLLLNSLKNNDNYKLEILNSSFITTLIDNISKLENNQFDFIKSNNNNCLNIDEITDNEILPENNYYYLFINNSLNINICTLMTSKIDNYFYNGIQINLKKNYIKDSKYMNNLFYIPTLNKNINIIIYQYDDKFEKDFFKNQNNIYYKFISLFKNTIKHLKINETEDNNNDNKTILWIPSFNIDTNIFSSKLVINNDINIKNEENDDIKIEEFNDFLKINYLPDKNNIISCKVNLIDNDNIIIKGKFLLGIYHEQFMEQLDIPIISLINVTCDNFIKS